MRILFYFTKIQLNQKTNCFAGWIIENDRIRDLREERKAKMPIIERKAEKTPAKPAPPKPAAPKPAPAVQTPAAKVDKVKFLQIEC